MIAYGTKIVGGVTPGKGGARHLDRPVFNTVKEAVRETGATASIVFVPAAFCADSIMEAAAAGIRFICAITDGIPAQDMMMVKRYLFALSQGARRRWLDPTAPASSARARRCSASCRGTSTCADNVGMVTRSGTLGYEAASADE